MASLFVKCSQLGVFCFPDFENASLERKMCLVFVDGFFVGFVWSILVESFLSQKKAAGVLSV